MSEEEFLGTLIGHDSDLKLAAAALRATGQPFCLIAKVDELRSASPEPKPAILPP